MPILPVDRRGRHEPVRPHRATFSHDDEHAEAGTYDVQLTDSDVHGELTATTRTGLASFTTPPADQAQVLVKSGTSLGGDQATPA